MATCFNMLMSSSDHHICLFRLLSAHTYTDTNTSQENAFKECVDWSHLVQDRDQWWTLVNMVMNFWVP